MILLWYVTLSLLLFLPTNAEQESDAKYEKVKRSFLAKMIQTMDMIHDNIPPAKQELMVERMENVIKSEGQIAKRKQSNYGFFGCCPYLNTGQGSPRPGAQFGRAPYGNSPSGFFSRVIWGLPTVGNAGGAISPPLWG